MLYLANHTNDLWCRFFFDCLMHFSKSQCNQSSFLSQRAPYSTFDLCYPYLFHIVPRVINYPDLF